MAEQDKKGFILVLGTCWGWVGIQLCSGSHWLLQILRTLLYPVIILHINLFPSLVFIFYFPAPTAFLRFKIKTLLKFKTQTLFVVAIVFI